VDQLEAAARSRSVWLTHDAAGKQTEQGDREHQDHQATHDRSIGEQDDRNQERHSPDPAEQRDRVRPERPPV
jgi:hypothetical protein